MEYFKNNYPDITGCNMEVLLYYLTNKSYEKMKVTAYVGNDIIDNITFDKVKCNASIIKSVKFIRGNFVFKISEKILKEQDGINQFLITITIDNHEYCAAVKDFPKEAYIEGKRIEMRYTPASRKDHNDHLQDHTNIIFSKI